MHKKFFQDLSDKASNVVLEMRVGKKMPNYLSKPKISDAKVIYIDILNTYHLKINIFPMGFYSTNQPINGVPDPRKFTFVTEKIFKMLY